MALLAEEIVEEWLNRHGYFTIRGVKIGVHEIDVLAVKICDSEIERRHVEVQASVRPVSYLTSVPKEVQKRTGRKPGSAKERSLDELRAGVKEWVQKKFFMEPKRRLREALCPGPWSYELVVHKVKHPVELRLIEAEGVKVHRLADVIRDLASSETVIRSAAGASLVDLVMLHTGDS